MSDIIKRLGKVHHHNTILDAFRHVERYHEQIRSSFTEAMLQWVKNIFLFKMLRESTADNVL